MRAEICLPRDLGATELERWRTLQQQDVALQNPFLSAEFAIAVGAARPNARVAVVTDNGRTVGFLPFELGRHSTARAIGAGVSDSQAFIHEQGLEWSWRQLLHECRLSLCVFDHLIAQNATPDEQWTLKPSRLVDISEGFDRYLAEGLKRSKIFKNALQQERRLSREFTDVHFEFAATGAHLFERLLSLKSAQYRRTGARDVLSRQDVRMIMEILGETRTPSLTSVLTVLTVDGNVIAGDFSLRSDTVMAGWFAAHDVAYAKYSPGLVRTLRMLEQCSYVGVKYLDLGKGEEEYKRRLSNDQIEVAEGAVGRPSIMSTAWRWQRAPKEHAVAFALRHQPLRLAARRTLRGVGSVRVVMHDRRHSPSS